MLTTAGEMLAEAIERLNDIIAEISAHQRLGRYDTEQLLDTTEADAREFRKMIDMLAELPG
jgi:hypothetical protein